jgi:hypothetical protein
MSILVKKGRVCCFCRGDPEDNRKRQITFAFSALHTLDKLHLSFVPG